MNAWPIRSHELHCEHTGEHLLWVALPNRYDTVDQPFPLLLTLDAPWMFGTVVDATRIMSMSKEAPEAIVAGLTFATDVMAEYLRQRARWLTPTPYVPPPQTGAKGLVPEECGRAAVYQAFIVEQVLPLLDATYRISDRTLIGHSFSGLFALRWMLEGPEPFERYLLASPSVWWDDQVMFSIEAERAQRGGDIDATVFLSAGGLEMGEEPFNMAPNIELLATRLRSHYPNLRLDHRVLEGDHHSSVIGAAVSKGLRSLFAPAALGPR